jgi:hypothetical protein
VLPAYQCNTLMTLTKSLSFSTTSAAMADGAYRALYCLVEGENKVFKAEASVHNEVADLKKLIQHSRKNGALPDVDATDLALWIVSTL